MIDGTLSGELGWQTHVLDLTGEADPSGDAAGELAGEFGQMGMIATDWSGGFDADGLHGGFVIETEWGDPVEGEFGLR